MLPPMHTNDVNIKEHNSCRKNAPELRLGYRKINRKRPSTINKTPPKNPPRWSRSLLKMISSKIRNGNHFNDIDWVRTYIHSGFAGSSNPRFHTTPNTLSPSSHQMKLSSSISFEVPKKTRNTHIMPKMTAIKPFCGVAAVPVANPTPVHHMKKPTPTPYNNAQLPPIRVLFKDLFTNNVQQGFVV
jgi:hypothetical protein